MARKIMMVDDDPSILDAATTALEAKGYEVIQASSGKECLNKLDGVSVVFLDIRMPEMDGIEILKKIKKQKPSVQVIMLTAFATVDTAIEAMKEGAIDYLRKPFEIEELEGGILAAIEEINFEEESGLLSVIQPGECFKRFKELSKNGKGLCVTNDVSIKERYGLDNASFIWLTDELENDILSPKKIRGIESKIEEFVQRNANAVVFLSNIEYLTQKSSLSEVRKLVKDLYEKISSNAILMISANLEKMDRKKAMEIENLVSDTHLGPVSDSISNYLRREIISRLSKKKKYSFTKMARLLGIKDRPKLSFHLKKLKEDGIIMQDEEKRHYLTEMGEDVSTMLEDMKRHIMGRKKNLMWLPVKRVK